MKIRYLYIFFLTIISGCISTKPPFPDVLDVWLRDGLMFLNLQVNNKKGVFLVDTGAGVSFVDINQAGRYEFSVLNNQNMGSIQGIGGSSSFLVTSNLKVKYEGLDYKGFKFYATNMNSVNSYFRKRNMLILGILGADFLAKSGAMIDYRKEQITLGFSEEAL